MPFATLDRVPEDVVLSRHIHCGDAVSLTARVLVPRAIVSRFTTSERVVVKVSGTSIVALLVGRQTEPHGAITLASPNIPYTPSTAFFGLFAVTAWSKRSANSFGRRRRSHGRRSQGSRNGCSWGGCLRIGWRRSARTGRHRPFPIADLERPIKHGTAWTNVGRDELPPCALDVTETIECWKVSGRPVRTRRTTLRG